MIALVAAALATPAAAQEWQVARDQFAFVGTRLTIQVDAETAGTLRILRGGPGTVRVASRAPRGFTAAGLADGDRLTLTAAGDGPVDYMVSVPEDVWVRVRLPGQGHATSVGGRHTRSFEWERPARAAERVREWLPPLESATLFRALARPAAPAVVRVGSLENVASLMVRTGGRQFQVEAGRPLSVRPGDEAALEIEPSGPPMDLVLTLPASTRSFRLVAGGVTALVIERGVPVVLCSPVIQQELSDGRRWVRFSPVDGTLRCDPPHTPRHEG